MATSMHPLEVDGERVDALITEIGDTFGAGDSYRDRRDQRDFALAGMVERWAEPVDSPQWRAVATLLADGHEMDEWGMRSAIIELVAGLDLTVSEGSSLQMSDVRRVNTALRDLNRAIDGWREGA